MNVLCEFVLNNHSENIYKAHWVAPAHVKTLITQANSFFPEQAPAEFGFNLATHVGDQLDAVIARRKILQTCYLPSEPFWLNQIHGSQVVCLDSVQDNLSQSIIDADASFSFEPNQVCVISTADCLPIFLSDQEGNFVAAIHAGWQGLYRGVIENSVQSILQHSELLQIKLETKHFIAFIGPSISQKSYQVDEAFYQRFVKKDERLIKAFKKDDNQPHKYLASLQAIAQVILKDLGIENIVDSGICSFEDKRFYSHRRNPRGGRFASLIWKQA